MKKKTKRERDLDKAERYIANIATQEELTHMRNLIAYRSTWLKLRRRKKETTSMIGVKKGLAKMRRRRQK